MCYVMICQVWPSGSDPRGCSRSNSDTVLGEKIGHGTPFRRCVEEGLLDCKRVVQIGLRGTGYAPDSYEWSRAQVPLEDL